jgi:outer membrane lipoprotein SlyB
MKPAPDDGTRPVPLVAQAPSAAVPVQAPPVVAAPQPQPQVAQIAPVPPAPAPRVETPRAPAAKSRTGTPPVRAAEPAVCATCGIVESVAAVREKGQGTGLGAVGGGVLGGVAGHQVGGGNGKTAMTVLGAIGGGLAGHEVEKRARSTTRYEVHVRMDNGTMRTFERTESMAVGTPVTVNGSTMRIANRGGSAG